MKTLKIASNLKLPLDAVTKESELNRRRDKLDFWQYVAAILAMAIMLLSAMLFFCKTAHAGGFVEVGQSTFKKPPDFLWWQSIYPNEFDNKPTYFRAGYEHKGFRLSYFDLGKYRLSALATSDEARLIAGQCNAISCAPPDLYVTSGSINGVLASYVTRYKGFFAEVGVSSVRQTFDLSVLIVNEGSLNGPVGNSYHYRETKKGGGYMAAIGIERGLWSLSAFYYNSNAGVFDTGNFPSGIGEVRGLSIGYRF